MIFWKDPSYQTVTSIVALIGQMSEVLENCKVREKLFVILDYDENYPRTAVDF